MIYCGMDTHGWFALPRWSCPPVQQGWNPQKLGWLFADWKKNTTGCHWAAESSKHIETGWRWNNLYQVKFKPGVFPMFFETTNQWSRCHSDFVEERQRLHRSSQTNCSVACGLVMSVWLDLGASKTSWFQDEAFLDLSFVYLVHFFQHVWLPITRAWQWILRSVTHNIPQHPQRASFILPIAGWIIQQLLRQSLHFTAWVRWGVRKSKILITSDGDWLRNLTSHKLYRSRLPRYRACGALKIRKAVVGSANFSGKREKGSCHTVFQWVFNSIFAHSTGPHLSATKTMQNYQQISFLGAAKAPQSFTSAVQITLMNLIYLEPWKSSRVSRTSSCAALGCLVMQGCHHFWQRPLVPPDLSGADKFPCPCRPCRPCHDLWQWMSAVTCSETGSMRKMSKAPFNTLQYHSKLEKGTNV